MFLTPYTTLTWAYQLHYYLCFRTHRRKQLFASNNIEGALTNLITEISANHDYHLLEQHTYPTQFRGLFSLQPSQTVAKTIQTIKSNSARELAQLFALPVPIWARGYLARSSGHVRTSAVRAYLDNQDTHHGYAKRVLPPIFKYGAQNAGDTCCCTFQF
jgi:REP element-mobilizing transposase RayT